MEEKNNVIKIIKAHVWEEDEKVFRDWVINNAEKATVIAYSDDKTELIGIAKRAGGKKKCIDTEFFILLVDIDQSLPNFLEDHTITTLENIFQVIDFPRALLSDRLIQLLQTPLNSKIHVYSKLSGSYPSEFFVRSTNRHDSALQLLFCSSLQITVPPYNSSEMVWSATWDLFFLQSFIVFIQKTCSDLENCTFNRNVEDSSITITEKRRDFNLWVCDRLVLAGEDKPSNNLNGAISDLESKNNLNAFTPAFYGSMEYVLGFATSGSMIQFFAIPNQSDTSVVPLVGPYNINLPNDRLRTLVSFINIIRWVRSLAVSNEISLEDIGLHKPIRNRSPFDNGKIVEITLHRSYVTKKFVLPSNHVKRFKKVYASLIKGNIRHSLEVFSILAGKTERIKALGSMGETKDQKVTLQLRPIASKRWPLSTQELQVSIRCVLEFLEDFHREGLVHRDIRWPNILKCGQEWLVIDYELSSLENEKVFWRSDALPPDVSQKSCEYGKKDDLYQVGQLFSACGGHLVSKALRAFALDLCNGKIQTAKEALDILKDKLKTI